MQLSRPKNVGTTERWLSVLGGAALILRGRKRPSMMNALLGLGGVGLVYRGLTGHCPGYAALGIDRGENAGARRQALPIAEGSRRRPIRDAIERASDDSFPASDPPAWTPTSAAGSPGARH